MKHVIIGTAGHVDHGKTALIKALTGRDTDRLREEKERGISIELGFAPFDLPGGRRAGVVDVPGHERFIHHMLAGVGGMDLVLFVVAADEGVMPQTREHLDILNLLGVKKGIVVLTKKDLVEEEWLELVTEEVRETLRGTFLAEAPLFAVSSVTGDGIPQLLAAIDALTQEVEERNTRMSFLLPIDRVFTITGFGIVVTGTLVAGTIRLGDKGEILPGDKEGRVRQLHVHGTPVQEAYAGQRVAVNLTGIDLEDVARGNVLAAPGSLRATTMVDCRLYLLPSAPRPLSHRTRVRFHAGTAEVMGRAYLLDQEELEPGDTGLVQFRLETPVAVRRSDRYVIRFYSPMVTIGGGEVLESHPPRRRRFQQAVIRELELKEKGDPLQLVEQGLREAGERGIDLADLTTILGLSPGEMEKLLARLEEEGKLVVLTLDQPHYFHRDVLATLRERARDCLQDFHRQYPLRWGMPKEELRTRHFSALPSRLFQGFLLTLAGEGVLELEREKVKLASHRVSLTPRQEALQKELENIYLSQPFSPPPPAEAIARLGTGEAGEVYLALVEEGTLVRLSDDLAFHRRAVEEAREKILAQIRAEGSITVSQLRDLLQTSRRYALPLLEYFDAQRLTRRVGDKRVLAKKQS
ncbi:MAG TPA: selenocysteine-specific translation elongation factor [Firmicutes bacterium]|nr:selenocysteine-specific translation elongation factor [Bacillota bacterium]